MRRYYLAAGAAGLGLAIVLGFNPPTPLPSARTGVRAEVGNMQWIAGNLEDGGPLDAAYREAVSEDTYVYVLSNVLASQPWPQETHGSDTTGDGTKGRPYLTFPRAVEATGLKFVEGKRVVFMLGGGVPYMDHTVDDGGMYDHLTREPALDPWDDQVVEMRQYNVRSIQVGGSESHWNSWAVRGPRKMVRLSLPNITDLTYTRDPYDGVTPMGRTKFRYTGDVAHAYESDAARGYYLRVTRDGGAGRERVEVTQPIQITGSAADSPGSANGYLYTDHGNYYTALGIYVPGEDLFEIVYRGAEFIPTAIPGDTGGADGITITGFGAYDTHARLTNVVGHNEGLNPLANFERVGFENANVSADGVSFETCYFYHQASFRGRHLELINSMYEGQSPVYWEATTRGIGSATEIQEVCGRAVTLLALFPDAGIGDPVWPDICGQSIYGFARGGGGSKFYVGTDHDVGVYRVWKGFSWEGGIEVRGRGSRFVMPDVSHTVHLSRASVALHVRDGAEAYIDPHTIFFGEGSNASTAHLKVGKGATIQLGGDGYPARSSTVPSTNVLDDGTFVYGLKWNGNFSRALESHTADSGYLYPDGDTSAIRDARVWWVP